MRDLPSVSVVVPVYNAERTLEQTITSLAALDYPSDRLELVVVDNGSTDRTADILAAYRHRLRILSESKRGPAAARNRGIHESRHSVIGFTDADCVVEPDWLRQLVLPLEDPEVGISGGLIRAVRPCNDVQAFGEWLHDHERAITTLTPPYAITMNWASRRNILLEAGGFDESLRWIEDVDLSYRLIQSGYRLVYQPSAIVSHHNKNDLRGLFREGFRDGFWAVRVLKKHRRFLRSLGHKPVNVASYKALRGKIGRLLRSERDPTLVCDTTFNSGKKIGRILGSIRFGHAAL